LGCGDDIRKGFINLDIRSLKDMSVCDVSNDKEMKRYRGADEILALDILEHFPREEARRVLKMWIELLRPGGMITIRCPDFRHVMTLPQSDERTELLLYGGQDYPENFHKCGFTVATLTKLLEDNGLGVIKSQVTSAGNLEIAARK
jgi:predicted SAM-dependent methyltransferase